MLISSKNLLGLPVFTKLGQELGKISGFDLDIDTQSITKYYVKKHSILAELLGERDLLIDQSQVVSISKEKMIVEDSVIEEKAVRLAKRRPASFSA